MTSAFERQPPTFGAPEQQALHDICHAQIRSLALCAPRRHGATVEALEGRLLRVNRARGSRRGLSMVVRGKTSVRGDESPLREPGSAEASRRPAWPKARLRARASFPPERPAVCVRPGTAGSHRPGVTQPGCPTCPPYPWPRRSPSLGTASSATPAESTPPRTTPCPRTKRQS